MKSTIVSEYCEISQLHWTALLITASILQKAEQHDSAQQNVNVHALTY